MVSADVEEAIRLMKVATQTGERDRDVTFSLMPLSYKQVMVRVIVMVMGDDDAYLLMLFSHVPSAATYPLNL